MKNEDFLDLLNEIDEEYIESASKRLENLHEFERKEFGDEMRPQVIRLEPAPKKPVPFRTGALAAVAAVLVCAVTAGVFVKLNKPPSYSPGSGVVLSEASHISEPSIPELTSSEPVSSEPTSEEPISYELESRETVSSEPESREPISSEPTSREPISSEPTSREPISSEPTSREPVSSEPFTEPKIKRLERDGYEFSIEINEDFDGKVAGSAGPFMKIDREEVLAICFACEDRNGQLYTIDFYSYDGRTGTVGEPIAVLNFTAESNTQWFSVPYKKEIEEGDECIMFISPVSIYNKSHNTIKGRILP